MDSVTASAHERLARRAHKLMAKGRTRGLVALDLFQDAADSRSA